MELRCPNISLLAQNVPETGKYERQNPMAPFFKSPKVSPGVFSASLSSLERQISTPDFLLCCSMFFSHSFFSLESRQATARKCFMEKWVFKVFPVLSCQGHLSPVAEFTGQLFPLL